MIRHKLYLSLNCFIALLIVTLVSTRATANTIVFKGNKKSFMFWKYAEICANDSLVENVLIRKNAKIDSLTPAKYKVTLISVFSHSQSIMVDIKQGSRATINVPGSKYYYHEKSKVSFFDSMTDIDTIRVFFTQIGCFAGGHYYSYAYITKEQNKMCITYTKHKTNESDTAVVASTVLTDAQIQLLKSIELGELKSKRKKGCTSIPTYYFELNKKIKYSEVSNCLSLMELIEDMSHRQSI
jgi:hypothetical protein